MRERVQRGGEIDRQEREREGGRDRQRSVFKRERKREGGGQRTVFKREREEGRQMERN